MGVQVSNVQAVLTVKRFKPPRPERVAALCFQPLHDDRQYLAPDGDRVDRRRGRELGVLLQRLCGQNACYLSLLINTRAHRLFRDMRRYLYLDPASGNDRHIRLCLCLFPNIFRECLSKISRHLLRWRRWRRRHHGLLGYRWRRWWRRRRRWRWRRRWRRCRHHGPFRRWWRWRRRGCRHHGLLGSRGSRHDLFGLFSHLSRLGQCFGLRLDLFHRRPDFLFEPQPLLFLRFLPDFPGCFS